MTDKTQPEALRLALSIDLMDTFTNYQQEELNKAAAELRRQHARIAELEAQLEAVGAGGVQALSAAPARRTGTIAHIGNGRTTLTAAIASVLAAPQQEAQELCPSCRNSDIYACTCPFPTSRNAAPQPAPVPLSEREEIAMIDAAMVEMANIVPPLKRSECARLIRAALAAQGGKA